MKQLTYEHIEKAFTENLWDNAVKYGMPADYENFIIDLSHINKKMLLKNRKNVETYVKFVNSLMENGKTLHLIGEQHGDVVGKVDLRDLLTYNPTEIYIVDYNHKWIGVKSNKEMFTNNGNSFDPENFANMIAGLDLYPRKIDIQSYDLLQPEYLIFLNEILTNYGYDYTKEDLSLNTNKFFEKNLVIKKNQIYDDFIREIDTIIQPYYTIHNSLPVIKNNTDKPLISNNIFSIAINTENLNKIMFANVIQDTNQDNEYYKRLIDNLHVKNQLDSQILKMLAAMSSRVLVNTLSNEEKSFLKNMLTYSDEISKVSFSKSKSFLNEALETLWFEEKNMLNHNNQLLTKSSVKKIRKEENKHYYQDLKKIIYKNGIKKYKLIKLNCEKRIDAMLFSEYYRVKNLDLIELKEKELVKEKGVKLTTEDKENKFFTIHIPEMNLQAALSGKDNNNLLVKSRILTKRLNFESELIKVSQKNKKTRTFIIHINKELRKDKEKVIDILFDYLKLSAIEERKFSYRIQNLVAMEHYKNFLSEIDNVARVRRLSEKMKIDDENKSNMDNKSRNAMKKI